jgi:hypothetical protein
MWNTLVYFLSHDGCGKRPGAYFDSNFNAGA